jgi:ParB family chromosome partitioning protein
MALDLSALEDKPASPAAISAVGPAPSGRPLMLDQDDVIEDPNQPRHEFPEEKMAEMTAAIKRRGVRQPLSVRRHPTLPGKWIINDGACRKRCSLAAGLKQIPAFEDETFDDYDQVNANEIQNHLKPMELAIFIQRKLNEGEKKADIARKLSKRAEAITELLALIEAPACIEAAYRSGRCVSPKTLYELRKLHNNWPEQVDTWCESQTEEITRAGVAALGTELKGTKKNNPFKDDKVKGGDEKGHPTPAGDGDNSEDKSLVHEQGNGKSDGGGNGAGGDGESDEKGKKDAPEIDLGELTSWPRGKAVSDPDSMKKPLLILEHEGRAAALLLNRRPSSPGLIRIRYEDGGGDVEVSASDCKINLLTEQEK